MSEHQRLQEQLHQQQLMREDHVEEDEEEEDDEVLQPGEYGGEEYYGEWSVCRSLLWDYHACHTDSTDSTDTGRKEGLWLKEQILVAGMLLAFGSRAKEDQDRHLSALTRHLFVLHSQRVPSHLHARHSQTQSHLGHQLSVVTSHYFRSSLTYFALFSGHFGTESQHDFATIRIRYVKRIGHRIDAVDCLVLLIRRTSVLCWGGRRVCGGRL